MRTAAIPKSTWVFCIPFFLYLAVDFLYLPISYHLTIAYLSYFLLECVRQLATGFWEETASKGLVMSGMLSKWEGTIKRQNWDDIYYRSPFWGATYLKCTFQSRYPVLFVQCLEC